MRFRPDRRASLSIHIAVGFTLGAIGVWGMLRLVRAPMNWQSALALLGVAAAAVGLPVILARLVALARASYDIDSQSLTIRWGGDLEVVPLDGILELRAGGGLSPWMRRQVGARSGWSRAHFTAEDRQPVEAFATSSGANLVLVVTPHGALAISPADLAGFVDAFSRFSAVISAEKVPSVTTRPPTLMRELLSSVFARVVVASTSAALLLLAMVLLAVQPVLALEHPFTFDAAGLPSGLGSPARLILLPALGALAWVVDLGLGWVAIRRRDFVAAYMLMGVGLIATAGLWVGVLTLLRFA
jgi:hypothetical protein